MFALILGAVRARTAQLATVLVLTALAAAIAAAGPWFAAAGQARSSAADVASAPIGQRILSAGQIRNVGDDPDGAMDQLDEDLREVLSLPGTQPVRGLALALTVVRGATSPVTALAYRDDFCDHLRLDGRCPAADREVAVSRSTAVQLGLEVGDTLTLRASATSAPFTVQVVGRYTRVDPAGPYWSNPLYAAQRGGLDPAFTPAGTFTLRQLSEPTIGWDVRVPDTLIRGDGGYDLATVLRTAEARLSGGRLRLVNPTGGLLDTIARDRATIRRGVLVSMVQFLILAWFAIGLAGRYTGRDRHGDAALLKLRGSSRLTMLRLAWGQHLVPLVLGVLIGAPVGWLLARLLGGPVGWPEAVPLSLAAVGAVLLGGLLALALVEAVVLRKPVAALLRRVPSGRRDWRAGLVDLLLLTVAAAAVYQARSGGPDVGLTPAAPALVALAVALLLARLLGRAADLGGGAAVRTGRLRLGLTAVQVSRQPGGDRVFALVVVAVAMFGTALGGWQADRTARTERSAAELGAARVLTVQAANRTTLLNAVRRADPEGHQAMAAVLDRTSVPPTLAVDSGRLAAVALWRPEYGPAGALPAAGAPESDPLPFVTEGRLSARLRHQGAGAVALTLVLRDEAGGQPVRVLFGRLRAGEQTVSAPVTGCSAAPGCRILRWELTAPPAPDGRAGPPPAGTEVTIREVGQRNPILGGARLADITRWRAGTALTVAAGDGTLRMTAEGPAGGSPVVYAMETALPLPIVLAGPAPADWQLNDPAVTVFGGGPVPVRPAAATPVLPVLGRQGILVDLDAARRLSGDANPPGQFQVWLAAGADPGIVERLTAAGLPVLADDSVAARARRLAEQGPPIAARFALLAGAAGLLLAAASVAVAGAVDRPARLAQLRDLRVQGLPGRTAVGIGYAGTAAPAAAGLVGGVLAAALAHRIAAVGVPPFTDGWQVLAPPAALSPAALGVVALLALAVLGLTGWLSLRPLVRGLRGAAR